MPKSDHEKAEIRRQTEARRRVEKDRSGHEANRGKKSMTLDDLAHEFPSEADIARYRELVLAESDRGAVIMASALVERALEEAIRAYLIAPAGGIADGWFKGPNAPFQSFSAKITLGRALGIYGPLLEKSLTGVRRIRNAFAHSMIPLDFSHPTVKAACVKLKGHGELQADARFIFLGVCIALGSRLSEHGQSVGGKPKEIAFP